MSLVCNYFSYLKIMSTMIKDFLWNGKKQKIKIETLQLPKHQGGLNLVNFKLKEQSLKASWVQILDTDDYLAMLAYRKLNITLGKDIWLCNIKGSDISIVFGNHFWANVLEAWSRFNFISKIEEQKTVLNQVIWFNSHLKIGKKIFFFSKPYKEGLLNISQIVDPQGNFLPTDVLIAMFDLTLMQINSLIACIPKSWKKLLKSTPYLTHEIVSPKYELFKNRTKCVSYYYRELNWSHTCPSQIYEKWIRKTQIDIPFDDFFNIFDNIKIQTTNVKLRSFQYRFLHCAIVLNRNLYLWTIKSDESCTNCSRSQENITHFFWECNIAQELWTWVYNFCKKLKSNEEITITKEAVFTNLINPKVNHVFNTISLIAKNYLYTTRCLEKKPKELELHGLIEKIKNYELYNAKKNGNIVKYHCKWLQNNTNVMQNLADIDEYIIDYVITNQN